MAFKALFMAHAADAYPEKHNTLIDTGSYQLYTYVVKTQQEVVETAKKLYEEEKIDSILLCPGFTHRDVAELFDVLGGKVSVCVSRGDGPSSAISNIARNRK